MNVLFLEWKSFGNDFMIETLRKKGASIESFPFPRETENTRNSETLATDIAQKLLNGNFTHVFSFNYFPVAAIACKACKVPYVAWVYDSPFIQLYSQTIKYDTNRVFVFDSAEVIKLQKLGVDTVQYLPMAGAVEWYDKMLPNKTHHEKYDCIIQYEDRKPIEFNFQCNPKYDTPNLDMCLNSIILDAYCYRDNPNLDDFLKEFGYEEDLLNVGNKAYEDCKKMYNTLSEVFTERELNELYKFEYCYSQDEIEYEAEELER